MSIIGVSECFDRFCSEIWFLVDAKPKLSVIIKSRVVKHVYELVAKIEELNELENLMEQLKAQADGLRDDIKSEMTTRGTAELNLGKYIVRWTSVLSTRFDTKRFKEVFGEELYKAYTKEVSSRRFSIA